MTCPVDDAKSFMAGGMGGVSKEEFEAATKKLREMKEAGMIEPSRGNLDDPSIEWRMGKPDYTLANLRYFEGKTMDHKEGSLEKIVENAVKTWEMEASHKRNLEQWGSVNQEKYRVTVNGSQWFEGKVVAEMGNYNALLHQCPKDKYDAEKETFESSHETFREAFPRGFPWEVLEVFSAPPRVHYSWRHWAHFDGKYRENQGDGSTVEMFGFGVLLLDENLRVCDLEVYYKPNEFLDTLEGKNGNKSVGTCPYHAGKVGAELKDK